MILTAAFIIAAAIVFHAFVTDHQSLPSDDEATVKILIVLVIAAAISGIISALA